MISEMRWPPSIEAINQLETSHKTAIYHTLIPEWVYTRFGVTRETLMVDGHPVVRLDCPVESRALEMAIRHRADAPDPLIYLNMADTPNNQLLVRLLIVNDPVGVRFDVDKLPDGRLTHLGTVRRNLVEEQRAMDYGLAPGQIRSGLRVFRGDVPLLEQFVSRMGHDLFLIEPMAYHNAITFERFGFGYVRGRATMERIHAEFQPGGVLHTRLDGSTPFRQPDAWQTVRGRSWAIQDGILDQPFDHFQMVKQIGYPSTVNTFPDSRW